MVFTLLLSFGSTANAASTWVAGTTGNWSSSSNWDTLPANPGTDTVNIQDGTATLDQSWQIGILLMDGTASKTGTLNVNTTGTTLTVYKSGSTELLRGAGTSGGTGVINHSSGKVRVYNGGGTGELRLSNATGATGTYNLSGTGVLDVEVLNKGASSRAGNFNATGGTLVVRNKIYKFGTISGGLGFNQGQCTLEIGDISTVAAINLGDSSNAMDYTVGTGGTMVFDVASASSYDTILQTGNVANIANATLNIRLASGYTPTQNSFFDVWTFADKSKAGSGAPSSITPGWSSSWVDTNADLSTDTLRLTYTAPEPATIALLGLGLLAMRRNKK